MKSAGKGGHTKRSLDGGGQLGSVMSLSACL